MKNKPNLILAMWAVPFFFFLDKGGGVGELEFTGHDRK